MNRSKQIRREREGKGSVAGKGGKDEEEQGGGGKPGRSQEKRKNGTEPNTTPTNQPPARSMGGREREKDTGKGKEGSGVLKESVRPTAKLQGWRDEEKRRSLLPPPLPPSPSEPCHKESVLPAVVGENKRKRRREGKNGGGSELPSQHPASPFFSATVGECGRAARGDVTSGS